MLPSLLPFSCYINYGPSIPSSSAIPPHIFPHACAQSPVLSSEQRIVCRFDIDLFFTWSALLMLIGNSVICYMPSQDQEQPLNDVHLSPFDTIISCHVG